MRSVLVVSLLSACALAACGKDKSGNGNSPAAAPGASSANPAPHLREPERASVHVLNFDPGVAVLAGRPMLFRISVSGGVSEVRVKVNHEDAGTAVRAGDELQFRYSFAAGETELEFDAYGTDASNPVAIEALSFPVSPAPKASSRTFNAYVLKAVDYLDANYALLGYDRNSEYTHELPYGGFGFLHPTNQGRTMCVAGVLEVILTAFDLYAKETGDRTIYSYLPFASWSTLAGGSIKARLWVNPKLHSAGTADALTQYGMGERRAFKQLEPGSFINLNRTSGSGHAVVFLGFIDGKGNDVAAYGPAVAGFRYFGAQGKHDVGKGGFGFRHAFFAQGGCPDVPFARDCKVVYSENPRLLNSGVLLAPTLWKKPAVIQDADAVDEDYPAQPDSFDGLTTDD